MVRIEVSQRQWVVLAKQFVIAAKEKRLPKLRMIADSDGYIHKSVTFLGLTPFGIHHQEREQSGQAHARAT
jgi:hypothetical protein